MILDTGYADDPVTYVYPGGVISLATAGGRFLVRCGTDWLWCAQTGLIAELDRVAGLTVDQDPADYVAPFQLIRGKDPIPWRSCHIRDAAASDLEARADLDARLKQELVRHIRLSPFYEGL